MSTSAIVNGRYLYSLDIISSDKVVEFVNEILDVDKIEFIDIMPGEKAHSFHGNRGLNGMVVITMKKNAEFNPFVAGLKMREIKCKRKTSLFAIRIWWVCKVYDNFFNRRENEIILR